MDREKSDDYGRLEKDSESGNRVSRRRFLKYSGSAVIVVVVAGVGAYLALQPQPQPATPAVTPTPVQPLVASPIPSPTPALVDKAKSEGAVTLYSSSEPAQLDVQKAGFEKKYPGIKVEIVRAEGAVLVQRYLTEYRAGKHILDVLQGSSTYILPALKEGIVEKYVSPETTAFPPEYRDPNSFWHTIYPAAQAIAYSTERVKGADIPKSYWDVLNPKFKRRLALYNPTASPHSMLISKRKIIGEARWQEFLKGLAAQEPMIVRGTGPLVTLMKNAELDIALWAYTGTLTEEMVKGAPIDYVRTPNTILGNLLLLWIYKYAPHPNASRLLLDYLISKEGAEIVNDIGKATILRTDAVSKMGVGLGTGERISAKDIAVVWPFTEEELDVVVKEFNEIFPKL